MDEENRQNVRYEEIGRVISPELCALPGILDNISATGCRVHFPVNVIVDLESEFDVKISLSRLLSFSRISSQKITLLSSALYLLL